MARCRSYTGQSASRQSNCKLEEGKNYFRLKSSGRRAARDRVVLRTCHGRPPQVASRLSHSMYSSSRTVTSLRLRTAAPRVTGSSKARLRQFGQTRARSGLSTSPEVQNIPQKREQRRSIRIDLPLGRAVDGPFFTAMPASGPSPRYASSASSIRAKLIRHGDALAAGEAIVEGWRRTVVGLTHYGRTGSVSRHREGLNDSRNTSRSPRNHGDLFPVQVVVRVTVGKACQIV